MALCDICNRTAVYSHEYAPGDIVRYCAEHRPYVNGEPSTKMGPHPRTLTEHERQLVKAMRAKGMSWLRIYNHMDSVRARMSRTTFAKIAR